MSIKFMPADEAKKKLTPPEVDNNRAFEILLEKNLEEIEKACAKNQNYCKFKYYAVEINDITYYKFWEIVDFLKEKGYRINPTYSRNYSTAICGSISALSIPEYSKEDYPKNIPIFDYTITGFNICW